MSLIRTQSFLELKHLFVSGTTVFSGPVALGNELWVTKINSFGADTDLDWVDIIAREAYYAP